MQGWALACALLPVGVEREALLLSLLLSVEHCCRCVLLPGLPLC